MATKVKHSYCTIKSECKPDQSTEVQATTFATKSELNKEVNNHLSIGQFNYAPKSYVDEAIGGLSIPDVSSKLEISSFTDYVAQTAAILDELQGNKVAGAQAPKIYYQDDAPNTDVVNGDIWIDSSELRLNIRHGDYWMSPDRVEDKDFKDKVFSAANTSHTFEAFKIKLMAALV